MSFIKGPNGEDVLPIIIDGQKEPLTSSSPLFAVESSQHGATVHYAQSVTRDQAIRAAESSYAAYRSWKDTNHVQRRDLLLRVADIVEKKTDELAAVQVAETSCTEEWGKFNVRLTIDTFREIASNISGASTGELPPLVSPGALCLVYREAIGPVLVITPWNGALVLCARAIAGPLAAGCSVVLKASELCPRVHHSLAEILEEAGLPAGVLNVIQASRETAPEITDALIGHPAIRKVSFTGSADIGRIIGATAAKYLKPVLMELGGKAPAIVLKDADIGLAAQHIAVGAMLNHGQICMSTDRIVVVKEVAEPLMEAVKGVLAAAFPQGAGFAVKPSIAKRAHELLVKAHANGAKFVVGDGSLTNNGASLTPTIITNIKKSDEIFDEEIFAPAAILTVVEDEAEAIEFANNTPHGLNASVHSKDVLAALRVAKQVEAGQVHIGTITEYDEATVPFGGTKASGWGRNNGKYALREYLIEKTISIHDPHSLEGNKFGKSK